MDIDKSKENIQPLRGGRNVSQLGTALQAQSDFEAQRQLMREKEEHEAHIRNYDGPDPLDPWFSYIQWVEQSFPKHGHEGRIDKLIKDCLQKFEKDERYAQDRRYLKLWIKYIDRLSNKLEVYQLLYNNGIGTRCSELYRAWACYCQVANDYKLAMRVFELGLDGDAQPRDELEDAHINFQLFFARRMLLDDSSTRSRGDNNLAETRAALTSLRGVKRRGDSQPVRAPHIRIGNAVRSSRPGVLPQGAAVAHSSNAQNNVQLSVYQDVDNPNGNIHPSYPSESASGPASSISLVAACSEEQNQREVGLWSGAHSATLDSRGRTPANSQSTPFTPYEDENIILSVNHKTYCVDDLSTFEVPLCVPDPDDNSKKPQYNKHSVYTDATEYSLEEIRSRRYPQRHQKCKKPESPEVNTAPSPVLLCNLDSQELTSHGSSDPPAVVNEYRDSLIANLHSDSLTVNTRELLRKAFNDEESMVQPIAQPYVPNFDILEEPTVMMMQNVKNKQPASLNGPTAMDVATDTNHIHHDSNKENGPVGAVRSVNNETCALNETTTQLFNFNIPIASTPNTSQFKRPVQRQAHGGIILDGLSDIMETTEFRSTSSSSGVNTARTNTLLSNATDGRCSFSQQPMTPADYTPHQFSQQQLHRTPQQPNQSQSTCTQPQNINELRNHIIKQQEIQNIQQHNHSNAHSQNISHLQMQNSHHQQVHHFQNMTGSQSIGAPQPQVQPSQSSHMIQNSNPSHTSHLGHHFPQNHLQQHTHSQQHQSQQQQHLQQQQQQHLQPQQQQHLQPQQQQHLQQQQQQHLQPQQQQHLQSQQQKILQPQQQQLQQHLQQSHDRQVQEQLQHQQQNHLQQRQQTTYGNWGYQPSTENYTSMPQNQRQHHISSPQGSPSVPYQQMYQRSPQVLHQSFGQVGYQSPNYQQYSQYQQQQSQYLDRTQPFRPERSFNMYHQPKPQIIAPNDQSFDAYNNTVHLSFSQRNATQNYHENHTTQQPPATPTPPQPMTPQAVAVKPVNSHHMMPQIVPTQPMTPQTSTRQSVVVNSNLNHEESSVQSPMQTSPQVQQQNQPNMSPASRLRSVRPDPTAGFSDQFLSFITSRTETKESDSNSPNISQKMHKNLYVSSPEQTQMATSRPSSEHDFGSQPDLAQFANIEKNKDLSKRQLDFEVKTEFLSEDSGDSLGKDSRVSSLESGQTPQSVHTFGDSENSMECQAYNSLCSNSTVETHEIPRPATIDFPKVIDPFNKHLCNSLLEYVKFPNKTHYEGYYEVKNVPKLQQGTLASVGGHRFSVEKQLGNGTFGSVFRCVDLGSSMSVALKYQKPGHPWEFYICQEIKARVKDQFMLPGYIDIRAAFLGDNASIFVSELSKYGSLLDVANKIKVATTKCIAEPIVMLLTCEILSIVHHLHKSQIIHADIKPDNFLLMEIPTMEWRSPSLQLIDLGCAIDMSLFPEGITFTKEISTDGFTCGEMRMGKPWTYQTDLYCIAGTVHVLLFASYMKTVIKNGKQALERKWPRYMKEPMWEHLFSSLLNVKDCWSQPDLLELKMDVESVLRDLESNLTSHLRTFANILKCR